MVASLETERNTPVWRRGEALQLRVVAVAKAAAVLWRFLIT